jgi:type II secretory pathway predicted ATPase ExeA
VYESYYGLERPAFTSIPDPDCLFLSGQHRQALSILRYAVSTRAGFCVVTGNVGAGKTTLVRSLLKTVGHDIEVGLVSNTQCESFEELMRWILLAFDLEYRGKDKIEMYDDLVRFMIDRFRKGTPVTLIIDEAQHLSPEYLEQMRMLSNVNTERGLILQTILVGQPELWDLLRRPELQQFTQRISYDYYLGPLESAKVTQDYITHRLRFAGTDREIFEEDTFGPIWQATGGVPRLINLVCDTALVYGYAEHKPTIPLALIEQVLADKSASVIPVVGPGAAGPGGGPNRRPDGRRLPRPSTVERAMAKRQR